MIPEGASDRMVTFRTDPRIDLVLQRLPRSLFIASPDLRDLISGRSIPSREVVRQILTRVPRIKSQQTVLMIGSGAGYLPAVVSHLALKVLVIERHQAIADIARRNLEKAGIDKVEIIIGDGEEGLPARMPFRTILVACHLARINGLLEQLDKHGNLVCFEGIDGQTHELVLYRKHNEEYLRRSLGPVSFARDTGEILIDLGYIDEKTLSRARSEARSSNQPILQVVRRNLNVEDADLYRSLAHQHGLRFAHAEEVLSDLDSRLFQIFSKTFLDNQRLIPVCVRGTELIVATDNPDARTEDIEHMHPYSSVVKLLVTPTDFRRIWSNIDITSRGNELLHWGERTDDEQDHLKDLLEESDEKLSHHLVSIYEAILLDAVSARASDIHIERYGSRIRVRIRTDGELRDLPHYKLTPRDHAGLINVIKVQAEINIAERRLPQGGRSQMRVGNATYDLRVQIQPSLHGEHAVIRILSQTGRVLGIDDLGMSPQIAANYRRLLDNPSGLVLVVGPTGSGKSTTLYAGLQVLADDGKRKVITVEDPIEYSIDNIQQTRVRPEIGFTFADAMRSFVRQDPDVILVGEIRDNETALEAMRASQTGHVVLSTLHSNDAVDALQRLYDLGVDPNSIAGEVLAIIAQRLAKRICAHCREEVDPDPLILGELFPEDPPAGFRCYAGKGCKECGGRGTRGRVGIVEYLHVNDDIRNAISAQPAVGELRWRALDSGLITMRDSALDHVIEGIIPLAELPRLLPQDRMAPEKRGGEAGR